MENILITLGERIRGFRKAKRLSQETLAEMANLHPTYISSIERSAANTSITTLQSIANTLDIDLADLFSFPKDIKPSREIEYQIAEYLGKIRNQDEKKQQFLLSLFKTLLQELRKL